MALQSVKVAEPTWYTLEAEEGEPNPARFRIRALNTTEQIEVSSLMPGGRVTQTCLRECFRIGVSEIENVTGVRGKPIKSSMQFLAEPDFMEEVLEVGSAVFDKSFLTEDERKNS